MQVGPDAPQVVLNLGCGEGKYVGAINVDLYGSPDVRHDLNAIPWPFESESVDQIVANHVFEHLWNWWEAFKECSRILKVGGELIMRVPDESSSTALGYRDHLHIITPKSFYGVIGTTAGTNAWAEHEERVPMDLVSYHKVPFREYEWMTNFPWLLRFCANHLRNFIHEQCFLWKKESTR